MAINTFKKIITAMILKGLRINYVMLLNQGVHYYSQVMPMAYAINLSAVQLLNEIKEIKKMF